MNDPLQHKPLSKILETSSAKNVHSLLILQILFILVISYSTVYGKYLMDEFLGHMIYWKLT